ncbi:hypothetical protein [Vibrio sp. H11]|uniref:hypothetical protein n=1 Tax=Vibrio sp. H11 TaxID=2565928 RepID=UPI0010A69CFC|nr:hypothetical protein [Vibrio sp. H11]
MATAKPKKTDQEQQETQEPQETQETPKVVTGVKLKLAFWDSALQRSFSAGDVYPCSDDEAARLIANGAAVSIDA